MHASDSTSSLPPSCSQRSSLSISDSPPPSPVAPNCGRGRLKITRTFRNGESSVETLTPAHISGVADRELYRSRSHVAVSWPDGAHTVLVIATPHSRPAVSRVPRLCRYLVNEKGLKVLVDGALKKKLRHSEGLEDGLVEFYGTDDLVCDKDGNELEKRVDFVVSLGGDGLILHIASQLFPRAVPPIMPFNMGSLGFLTPFNFKDYRNDISDILSGANNTMTLRMRLQCTIRRHIVSPGNLTRSPCVRNFSNNELYEEEHEPGKVLEEHHVLNEIVIDRGPAPYLSNLEVLCDDCPVTRVQADGLIIGTPTGSTAYSLSSGGSMVHPSVPTILFTPICPHSLSFRPVLFPSHVTLEVKVPKDARASAWASFDGRHRVELQRGDSVIIKVSPWSVPTFSRKDTTKDWFASVSDCLRWNERVVQKPLDVDVDDEADDISIIESMEHFSLK